MCAQRWLVLGALGFIFASAPSILVATGSAAEPGFAKLVVLFQEWRHFQQPEFHHGVPDYRAAAMAKQHRDLRVFQERLADLDSTNWPLANRVDHRLVQAEMNGLDFDHRILQPWARDPAFYAMVIESESDTPLTEGPVIAGAIEIWRLNLPVSAPELQRLHLQLEAIPAILLQARGNLLGDAQDLWRLGIRTHEGQSAILQDLAELLGGHHSGLVTPVEKAQQATTEFIDWLKQESPRKTGPSGIGVDHYSWYLQNVHLVPFSWEDELRLMERELARAVAHMKLAEHQNRGLPPLEPPVDAREWELRSESATVSFMNFLADQNVLEIEDFMEPALRERLQPFSTPEESHFFAQVNLRDPRVLHCHFIHWIEKAYLRDHPHASPIRSQPSLYNIWDSRSEGLATGMEEMMMSAGMFEDSPRSRELVYIMVAMRAARAIAGLRVQSNDWTVDEAVRFATGHTPRGWFRPDGNLVLFEQQLYLRQPGYGTSYLSGKALIEILLAERAMKIGDEFTLQGFMTELFEAGMIPVSLGRWEITGHDDWLPEPIQR